MKPTPDDEAARRVLAYVRDGWDANVRHAPARPNIEPVPFAYTPPCTDGRFVALFYWDTQFTNLGLIAQDRLDLAASNCDALLWLLDKKGFVPNSIFVGDDTRSQPPYLAMMVADLFEADGDEGRLRRAVPLLEREYDFWTTRRATPCGLSRHFHHADDEFLRGYYSRSPVRRGGEPADVDEATRVEVANRYLAEAETGWDYNPRFGRQCPDFCPADLNSNLYLYERLLARFTGRAAWDQRAEARRDRMNDLMWDDDAGLFRDHDFVHERRNAVASMATFAPLWAGLASDGQAARVAANLPRFEREHGLTVCEPRPGGATGMQWDYPNLWPPSTWLAVAGLLRYGHDADARRIAAKFVRVVCDGFAQRGQLWEKFDAVEGGPAGGEYDAQPMLGWTAGVFVRCCDLLGLGV